METLDTALEAPPFPKMHNLAGENLMETIARMLTMLAQRKLYVKRKWKKRRGVKEEENERLMGGL